jgi:cyclopropane fatty-acyl-phospholipid synthase-like methyltransferase
MAARIVEERLGWAMQTLAIDPADHVMEIGCGRGAAVSLVCERLTSGKITAIDRSAAMITLAERRNAANVAAGKAVFVATALDAADLGGDRFDKIFAINVNLFWVRSSSTELGLVRRWLKPEGAMYLFYRAREAARAKAIAENAVTFLTEHGFSVTTLTTAANRDAPVVCLVARTSRAPRDHGRRD